jgi:SAM-dependent methyltransferase
MEKQPQLLPNVLRFIGFADMYEKSRPAAPANLGKILAALGAAPIPQLVVDIASGTGLATFFWEGLAKRVIGIEPNPDMRAIAEKKRNGHHVSFVDGLSWNTGLAESQADIVTCSQALHWLDPFPTFREIHRILRSDGVFAAYDYDVPPATLHWELDQASQRLREKIERLERDRFPHSPQQRWSKDLHIQRMKESGCFRFVTEILLQSIEKTTSERLMGFWRSLGGVEMLLKSGLSEHEIGLTELENLTRLTLGSREIPWYFSYRVRVGIK